MCGAGTHHACTRRLAATPANGADKQVNDFWANRGDLLAVQYLHQVVKAKCKTCMAMDFASAQGHLRTHRLFAVGLAAPPQSAQRGTRPTRPVAPVLVMYIHAVDAE